MKAGDSIDYTSDAYHRERHPEMFNAELRRAWSQFARVAYLAHVQAGERVLEFGAGFGANLLAIADMADCWAVEPSAMAREVAARDGLNVAARLRDVKTPRFDTVLCRHVLEHVEEPLGTLRELGGRLAPNGRMVLVVPCEDPGATPVSAELDHHLYCWNARTLGNLVRRAGLTLVEYRIEGWAARRLLLPVYRRFGGRAYAMMVRMAGRALRTRETVMTAEAHE